MSSPALPLTPIVNVSVLAGPALGTPPTLNQGLIVGASTHIPSYGGAGENRVRQYNGLAAMTADSFALTDPEYIAAELYFAASPAPQYVWVGCRDATSLKTVVPHAAAAGTGYAVNDTFTVTQGGATLGQVRVATIGALGAVTGLEVITAHGGTGYTVAATGLATTNVVGSGTGLTVDISAVGETPLVAFVNCRLASTTWYAGMVIGAVAADHEALALFAESAEPKTFYYGNTSDADVITSATDDIATTLKEANYKNTALVYATVQGSAAPNNIYAAAAAMGYEMGANTGLPNSYFTEWGKMFSGVRPEPLTQAQVNFANGKNCNVYVGYVNQYTIFQPGITPSGTYIDQVLNRAILQANLQFGLMNLLVSVPSVPQTDPGEQMLIHTCNEICQAAVNLGYLAPGTYEGIQPVINLDPGDPLPAGFLAQAYPYSMQSSADHAARKAMPIYIVVNEAGAAQSVVVGVIVNL